MADVHTIEQSVRQAQDKLKRSKNMAAIRGKDTKPEMIVRKYLWAHGFRYRLNYNRLPGKPDVVLRKYRTCIFVNGCFWHGHGLQLVEVKSEKLKVESMIGALDGIENSECCKIPKTNREFWVKKITRNQQRDKEVQQKLAAMGWHCITIWECQLKPNTKQSTLCSLELTLSKIFLDDHKIKKYELEDSESYMAAEDSNIDYK